MRWHTQLISNKIQSNSVITAGKEFLSLKTGVAQTEDYNVIVHSKKLVGTAEYLTL